MAEEFRHIVRIAGKDLNGSKPVKRALIDIKGVSHTLAKAATYIAKVDPSAKLGDLSKEQVELIEKIIKKPIEYGIPSWMVNRRKDYETGADMHIISHDIDMNVRTDIGRERRMRSRRGIRHELGLRVRGQRTRTTGRKGLAIGVAREKLKAAAAPEAAAKKEKKKE